jgi:Ser/Thr protein kinase RdoA (MazF antagonist)
MSTASTKTSHRPTDTDAREIVSRYVGNDRFYLKRFPTGLCHYVYEVTPQNGEPFVLRMGHSDTRDNLAGSVYWTEQLSPLGIPIPKILFKDLSGAFPYTILNRIPGQDLGDVYALLQVDQKKALACEVAHWQAEVGKMPLGKGYGFGYSHNDPRLKLSWLEVINSQIDRARNWISAISGCNLAHVDRVEQESYHLISYLEAVQAKPFLHDTTTKNVLISEHKLSGIVDIDDVCFGDPLLVVALTRMALLSGEHKTDYISFWCEALKLSDEQVNALNFYTALFCVSFMGEIGQKFNKETVEVDMNQVKHFEKILDMLLEKGR